GAPGRPLALILSCAIALGAAPAFAAPAAPPPGAPPAQPAPPKIEGPTTTDLSALKLDRHLIFVRLEKGFYEVMELLDFDNQGKETIVSKDGAPTFRLTLARSSNVRRPDAEIGSAPHGLDQGQIKLVGAELLSTEPVPPGRKMVVHLYRLADEYGGITIEKPLAYGSGNFVLLAEKDRVQASAQGLNPQDPITYQERIYNRFLGATRPGATVRFHVQAPASTGEVWIFYAAGGAFLAVGGLVGLLVRQRRNRALAFQVERESLLRQIAALDDRLALGEIAPEAHGRERRPRFARLRELSGE
ncbi:MAG: hypothetical protein AABZ64_06380, partial [Nitrospinota bacterium]